MRLAIIGASGQLGSDLMALAGDRAVPLYHADVDIADAAQVDRALDGIACDAVINLAAFHHVDNCETYADQAQRVNGLGVRNLALNCLKNDRILMHFSTDYVFDGRAGRPYTENDAPMPLSAYGNSKAAGEYFVRSLHPKHYVIRTTGLYGLAGSSGKGGNFVETMLRMGREGRALKVVDDQVMSPTATADLAPKVLELLETGRFGLYHATNSGWCSWFEFARTIFQMAGIDADLRPTTSAAYAAPAARPAFSALENRRLVEAGLQPIRHWREGLGGYLDARKAAGRV
ncbi:MAG: dTDP-4-dehydrorhamnose reductase [Chloroflexi bacterium]|nr:dTDP-4-dehydrorhamnose reductase [Chloroflexota bacterium]